MKKRNFFWVCFADLMVALFFLMLISYRVYQRNAHVEFSRFRDSINVLQDSIEVLKITHMGALDDFIENLKDTIRVRDAALIEIKDALIATESEMAKITELRKMVKNINPEYFSYDTLTKKHVLKEKGFFALGDAELNLDIKTRQWLKEAGNAIRKFVMSDPDIYYMLILEGEASREGEEYFNYNLSYKRALALIRFWQREKIDLNNIPNCELFIAGSGYYKSEKRQFTVQIIPKAGIIE